MHRIIAAALASATLAAAPAMAQDVRTMETTTVPASTADAGAIAEQSSAKANDGRRSARRVPPSTAPAYGRKAPKRLRLDEKFVSPQRAAPLPEPSQPVRAAPRPNGLPDPVHPDVPVVEATAGELLIASALNKSLDRWRICGWDGQEEAAAVYNAWTRTHYVADNSRMNYGAVETAWDVLGRESAIRIAQASTLDFNANPETTCRVSIPERVEASTNMHRQMIALIRASATTAKTR